MRPPRVAAAVNVSVDRDGCLLSEFFWIPSTLITRAMIDVFFLCKVLDVACSMLLLLPLLLLPLTYLISMVHGIFAHLLTSHLKLINLAAFYYTHTHKHTGMQCNPPLVDPILICHSTRQLYKSLMRSSLRSQP